MGNFGDEGPPGQHPYAHDGRQDDPPHWHVEGGLLMRDDEVVAMARDHAMAFFLAAVLRRFAAGRFLRDDEGERFVDEHAGDNPGPGIGGR